MERKHNNPRVVVEAGGESRQCPRVRIAECGRGVTVTSDFCLVDSVKGARRMWNHMVLAPGGIGELCAPFSCCVFKRRKLERVF